MRRNEAHKKQPTKNWKWRRKKILNLPFEKRSKCFGKYLRLIFREALAVHCDGIQGIFPLSCHCSSMCLDNLVRSYNMQAAVCEKSRKKRKTIELVICSQLDRLWLMRKDVLNEWKQHGTRISFARKMPSKLMCCFISPVFEYVYTWQHRHSRSPFPFSRVTLAWESVRLKSILFICLVRQAVKQFVHADFVTMEPIELNKLPPTIGSIEHFSGQKTSSRTTTTNNIPIHNSFSIRICHVISMRCIFVRVRTM